MATKRTIVTDVTTLRARPIPAFTLRVMQLIHEQAPQTSGVVKAWTIAGILRTEFEERVGERRKQAHFLRPLNNVGTWLELRQWGGSYHHKGHRLYLTEDGKQALVQQALRDGAP